MPDYTWFLSGGWPELERVRSDIDSYIYGWCEVASDDGRKFQVSIEVTEIS